MRRYPPFDPPEYVAFRPDPEVMQAYGETIRRDPARRRLIERLGADELLRLYAGMVRFRLHDVALKRWVRQGIISKAWLGTGEEAVTVGSVQALRQGDQVGPMIRNAGACHEMGMPVADMLKAYLGTGDQITRGRDLHTGDPARGVIPPTSMMACLVPVFAGIGIALRNSGKKRIGLTYVGDGASRTTAFHEGMNLAAVLKVPIIVVLQNNQVALGTPVARHCAGNLADLHTAYGALGLACDGNNVLDMFAATRILAERCRRGLGPALLTAETFRMGGHATHDEAEARALFTPDQFHHWGLRDPIGTYEAYLIEAGLPRGRLEEIEARVTAEVEAAAEAALESRRTRMPAPEEAIEGVYAPPARPARPAGRSRRVEKMR